MGVFHSTTSGIANPADPDLVGGEDWDEEHVGQADWNTVIVQGSDQVVTDNTLVNSDLVVAVGASETWRLEYSIVFLANNGASPAVAFQHRLLVASGVWESGWWRHLSQDSTTGIFVSTGIRLNPGFTGTATVGPGSFNVPNRQVCMVTAEVTVDTATNLQHQFSCSQTVSGKSVTLYAGSCVNARRLV